MLLTALGRFAPDVAVLASGREPERVAGAVADWPMARAVDPQELASTADLVVLCLPPQAYRAWIEALAPTMRPGAILVSVTNAVTLEDLGRWCANPVIKIIPSPAHAVGRGACLLTAGPRATAEQVERVRALFARFCRPVLTDPADARIASNLAGCAPAILAAFCASFLDANAARAQALDPEALRAMLAESVGALAALLDEGASFEDVMRRTATPGGTTEAAIDALAADGPALCARIVEATFQREAQLLGIPPPRSSPATPGTPVRG
ncbi:pyrroline-5-carboxylate reductase family protein [Alsobacter metallidurans]|uniref:pyrroline-5-carboxylate reductase family protein n=1 Tax=Alsobacter metallidurans TaxID=340221 RepID=UPI001FCEE4BA|nr:pyrroline-5-carboxylate reductase dimerization domain-containing protein [Alsobacter metallidurans]